MDDAYPVAKILSRNGCQHVAMKISERGIEHYARFFRRMSQSPARLAVSINMLDGSVAATGGGGGGGGGGGPPLPGGVVGAPGGNGPPPGGKIGTIGGMKIDPGSVSGATIPVVGGATSGISGGATSIASGPRAAGSSIASGEGSAISTGSPGTSESRLPQRVRAMCAPSVSTASPAGRVIRFFVQKIRLPTR